MEVQLKLWKSNKCATLPTCNSLLQVPFCFGCLKMQEQRFPKYWFSFTCLMPWFRSSLLLFLDALCSFIIARMRVGLTLSCGHAGALLKFGDTCPWKICPYNANMQRPFFFKRTFFLFLLRAVRTASEVRKMRPKYGNIRPVWTRPNQKDFFSKKHLFLHVRPSVKTVSAAGTTRSGRVDVLKPRECSA